MRATSPGFELFEHHLANGVEVTVRLEKRLAALMMDLAEHQRRELGESLLHTCDGVTPHTASTVRQIQRLKEKHEIDYDTHASYRFVER